MILRPIIVYAAPAWCSTSNTNLNSLQVFQNKQLRLIRCYPSLINKFRIRQNPHFGSTLISNANEIS